MDRNSIYILRAHAPRRSMMLAFGSPSEKSLHFKPDFIPGRRLRHVAVFMLRVMSRIGGSG